MDIDHIKTQMLDPNFLDYARKNPQEALEQCIDILAQTNPRHRYELLTEALLKMPNIEIIIRQNPDMARGYMADITKLLPPEYPSFTNDIVSAHKRENYDSIYTLVIFFTEAAEGKDKEARVWMACKKDWKPDQLASYWCRNPKAKNNRWESHKRRIMLPYFVKAFSDIADNKNLATATRLAAHESLVAMKLKIGRVRPDLFEKLELDSFD